MCENEDTSDDSRLGYNHLRIEYNTTTVYGCIVCYSPFLFPL